MTSFSKRAIDIVEAVNLKFVNRCGIDCPCAERVVPYKNAGASPHCSVAWRRRIVGFLSVSVRMRSLAIECVSLIC